MRFTECALCFRNINRANSSAQIKGNIKFREFAISTFRMGSSAKIIDKNSGKISVKICTISFWYLESIIIILFPFLYFTFVRMNNREGSVCSFCPKPVERHHERV